MIEFIKNHKFFLIYSGIIFGIALNIHPETEIEFESETVFYKKIRFIQFCTTAIFCLFYYFIFLKKNAKYKAFYSNNEFYCRLMYFTTMGIILSTIYLLNWEIVENESRNGNQLDVITHNSVKVWEVGSYLLTTIYTYWLWFRSENGTKILDDVEKSRKRFGMHTIAPAIFILIGIVIMHSYIIFLNKIDILKDYQILITLALIIITYIIFYKITRRVITTTDDTSGLKGKELKNRLEINQEFKMALKFIEHPTLIIFGIMFAYALYCTSIGVIHEMETFFSGAIAFELLLSSIVWAKTETV